MTKQKTMNNENLQSIIGELVHKNIAFFNLNKSVEENIGLSLVQYYLLNILKDMPGCTPQKLAQIAGLHPSTLTQSMKRFSRKKFIFIEEDPRDSRKKIVGLTLQGKMILTKFESHISEFLPNRLNSNDQRSSKLRVMQNLS